MYRQSSVTPYSTATSGNCTKEKPKRTNIRSILSTKSNSYQSSLVITYSRPHDRFLLLTKHIPSVGGINFSLIWADKTTLHPTFIGLDSIAKDDIVVAGVALSIAEDDISIAEDDIVVVGVALSIAEDDISIAEDDIVVVGVALSIAEDDISIAKDDIGVASVALSITEDDIVVAGVALSIAEDDISIAEDDIIVASVALSIAEDDISIAKDDIVVAGVAFLKLASAYDGFTTFGRKAIDDSWQDREKK